MEDLVHWALHKWWQIRGQSLIALVRKNVRAPKNTPLWISPVLAGVTPTIVYLVLAATNRGKPVDQVADRGALLQTEIALLALGAALVFFISQVLVSKQTYLLVRSSLPAVRMGLLSVIYVMGLSAGTMLSIVLGAAIPPTFEYLAALVALLGIGAAALKAVEGISSASLLRGLEEILCREFERLTYYEEVRLQASEAVNRVDGLSTSRQAGDSPYISSRAGWVMDINLKALQGIAQTNGPITVEALPYTWIGPPRPLPLCFVKPGFEDHGRISSAFYFLKRDHQFYLKGYNLLNRFHTAVRTAIVAGDIPSLDEYFAAYGKLFDYVYGLYSNGRRHREVVERAARTELDWCLGGALEEGLSSPQLPVRKKTGLFLHVLLGNQVVLAGQDIFLDYILDAYGKSHKWLIKAGAESIEIFAHFRMLSNAAIDLLEEGNENSFGKIILFVGKQILLTAYALAPQPWMDILYDNYNRQRPSIAPFVLSRLAWDSTAIIVGADLFSHSLINGDGLLLRAVDFVGTFCLRSDAIKEALNREPWLGCPKFVEFRPSILEFIIYVKAGLKIPSLAGFKFPTPGLSWQPAAPPEWSWTG